MAAANAVRVLLLPRDDENQNPNTGDKILQLMSNPFASGVRLDSLW
jgi:hypothetical protein